MGLPLKWQAAQFWTNLDQETPTRNRAAMEDVYLSLVRDLIELLTALILLEIAIYQSDSY
uniref:Uncharacterized protein n=1 Tax=viral metagenome TaxID=1070528 RepID=A0A6M3JTE0_9ZZZZ